MAVQVCKGERGKVNQWIACSAKTKEDKKEKEMSRILFFLLNPLQNSKHSKKKGASR